MRYLGKITVIEYKSPDDKLSKEDFDTLRIYSLLSKKKYNIEKDSDICMLSLSSHFEKGYFEYVRENDYSCREVEPGIWGAKDRARRYYAIDLDKIGKRYKNHPINLFSSRYREFISSSAISTDHIDKILYIRQMILKGVFEMKDESLKGFSEFKKSIEEITEKFLASLTLEERLKGLKPEDRLIGLKPEELMSIFTRKDLIKRLTKEEKENLKKMLEQEEE